LGVTEVSSQFAASGGGGGCGKQEGGNWSEEGEVENQKEKEEVSRRLDCGRIFHQTCLFFNFVLL
jgi:hypothetical protein